jgi:hypothetical protein
VNAFGIVDEIGEYRYPKSTITFCVTSFYGTARPELDFQEFYKMHYYVYGNGEQFEKYANSQINIAAPIIVTDEEKAKQAQEAKEQQTVASWWVSLLIGFAAIAILVSVIIVSKFSRMMKMK